MKTFPSAFAIEKNKATGAKPIWILKFTLNSVNYYCTGKPLTIPSFSTTDGFWPTNTIVGTFPLVKQFGSVHQGITNWLSEFQVSEFSVSLILNTDYVDLENLLLTYDIEENPVELYIWFKGCSDSPQRVFHGYVKDLSDLSDTVVSLSIQDDTIKLEKSYIGTKVTETLFPSGSASDVGKVIPIPFGTVYKVPALVLVGGVQLTLKTTCTIAATTLYVSDVTKVTSGMIFCIDSEQIYVSSIGTDYLTVQRAYNSTVATAHSKGTSLVQVNTQVYCFSGRAVTSISKVWLKQSEDVFIDISSYCSKYTGQTGSQLSGYGSYGCVQLTSANMISILNILNLTQTDTIDVDSSNLSLSEATTNGPQSASGTTSGYQVFSTFGVFNNSEADNRAGITLTVSATFSSSYTYDAAINLCSAASQNNRITTLWSENNISGARDMNFSIDLTGSNLSYNYIEACIGSSNVFISVRLNGATRVIKQISTSSGSGVSVNKTGTAQMTGSNMSTYFGSGKIFVDVVSDCNTAQTAANYILSYNNMLSSQLVRTIPSYVFNGCITEYKTSLWWLNYIAIQSQAWFSIVNGTSKLISRTSSGVDKIISACRINSDGTRVLTRKKTDSSEIINKINLLYNRDLSLSSGDDSYMGNYPIEDVASQSKYGLKEQEGTFKFDLITLSLDAINLASFYLTNYKDRHWIAQFDVFLDHLELEFGDYIQLGFLNNVTGFVLSASHTPGSYNAIDTITLTVLII